MSILFKHYVGILCWMFVIFGGCLLSDMLKDWQAAFDPSHKE